MTGTGSSALAQSAAAIVGIFGAFIITKILSNQSDFSQKSSQLKELLSRSQRLTERRIIYWDEKRRKEEEERRRQEELRRNNPLMALRSPLDPWRGMDLSKHILNPNLGAALAKERESIDFVLREIRSNIRTINNFLDTVRRNLELSPQIMYSLLLIVILFFAGVVYPLSFLPTPNADEVRISIGAFLPLLFSLRGVLLTAVSVVFMAVVLMFFVTNLRLKYRQSDVAKLGAFTELPRYSKYYGIMKNNLKQRQHRDESLTKSLGETDSCSAAFRCSAPLMAAVRK